MLDSTDNLFSEIQKSADIIQADAAAFERQAEEARQLTSQLGLGTSAASTDAALSRFFTGNDELAQLAEVRRAAAHTNKSRAPAAWTWWDA